MYFLKSKTEVSNKAAYVSLVRKQTVLSLGINKDGLNYLGSLECNPLGSQNFSLCQQPLPASGPELCLKLDPSNRLVKNTCCPYKDFVSFHCTQKEIHNHLYLSLVLGYLMPLFHF